MPNRDEIEQAFCALQAQAWVAGAVEVKRDDGLWHIELEDGPWRLDDAYRRGSDWSSGFTILTYDGETVLLMWYGGQYKKEARQCLKDALRHMYERGLFRGGRGPLIHEGNGLRYHNDVKESTDVDGVQTFRGREVIHEWRGAESVLLGFHNYDGMIWTSS